MKPSVSLRSLLLASSALLTISYSHATNLYWDGTSASWSTAANWSTASGATTPDPLALPSLLDDLIFNISTANGNESITLDANQFARSLTFNNTGTTTFLGGGSARTLTLGTGGITIAASAGAVTLGDGTAANDVLLSLTSGAQTWTNNSAANFTINNSTASFTRAAGATLLFNKVGAGDFLMSTTVLPNGATGIIGNWASFGTGTNTRYAYNNAGTIAGYSGTSSTVAAIGNTPTVNYDVAAVGTLGAGANVNTLRYTGAAGTIAGALTTNGIMNVSGNLLTFSGAITSGSGEMVFHAANGGLKFNSSLSLGANTATFVGSGNFDFSAAGTSLSSTGGGIVMNGTGQLLLPRAAGSLTYTGTTTINNGTVMIDDSKPTGNFILNNGMLTDYYQTSNVFSGGLGSGNNQIQIYGVSGFGGGNANSNWTIGTAGSVLQWGSTFFNPTTLTFLVPGADNMGPTIHGLVTLANGLDLNGGVRTIAVQSTSATPVSSTTTISGTIINSTGTGDLIKTGAGNLILSNAGNTYNGSTTISAGTLTANSTGALGNSSATNTLIFNGGTLRAGGTITSVAARSVTMTSTGIIDTNAFAVSIAGNIGGAGGLTKNSTGTLSLSGTNTYGGVTTVNAGTLAVTKTAALASNTAANLNIKSGATLQLNVGGAGEFAATDLNTLLGNISVANTTAQGLQGGAILALDTTNAGGSFTQGNAITNSTGANGGAISLTKFGTGTLVIDKTNTYTGPTTISAGTLQLNAGGVIAASILNNATFTVNSAGAVTQGTHLGLIGGTGTLTKTLGGTLTLNLANTFSGTTTVSAGTLALTNGLALQNSALVTTSGTSTYSGGAALTIGGLSGATGNLGSASVLNGYTGIVSALTLNPQTGVSVTYGGTISNGTGAMTLTKTGAGTQILTGANSYTGATIVNAGTLTIGAGGSLSASSDLQISGGIFSYGNTSASQTLNGLTVGAGNSTLSNTASGQTLTLGAITRTAGIFGTVNFATLTGAINTSTGNTNGIIGPWATTGATTTLRYAVGGGNISAFTTGTPATANTLGNVTDATVNYEYSAAVAAMPASTALTGNTLRYSGGATGTAINATSSITLNGLMQAGTGTLTISGGPSTGGILIGSTGELVIAANAQATTISATIGGTGRLVYSGAGSTLTLSSTTNAYTGGTVINSGTLAVTANTNLGAASGGITLNGGRLSSGNFSMARIVTVNGTGSSILVGRNSSFTTTEKLTGAGTLTTVDPGGGGNIPIYNFNSTANDYTGRLDGTGTTINVNSFANSSNSIVLNGGIFNYGTGAVAATSLSNRVIEMSGTTGGATITNSNTTVGNTLSIGGDLLVTGVGNKTLTLNGANTGANTFSGKIADGPGSVISLSVSGSANWIVSGNNTYSGQTTISGNTGAALTLSGDNSAMTGNVVLSTSTGTATSAPRLNINSATALGTGVLTFGGGAATDVVRIDNTSAGAVNVSTANAITMNRNFTFVGTQNLSLGTGTTTLGGMTSGTNRSITVTDKTLTLNGTIAEAVANLGITKAGAGTLLLSGTGNSYTGATTVSAGTLAGIGANAFGSTSGISIAAASSATLSLRGDSSTSFVKTSDSSLYSVTTTASGATINVDQATIAGTGAKTMTIGTLALNNAVANVTTFTGANNTSLSIGAVTTAAAASGTETLTNNIASTGSLTLASLAVTRTGTPEVVFNGTGNTTVSGAISQAAITKLTMSGSGILKLNGSNSYTGITTITSGTLEAATLDIGGNNSGIGKSSNAAASLVFGAPTATLRYTGGTNVTTDRGFTLSSGVGGGATIESSGVGTLSFNNTVALAYGTTAQTRTLTLGGTNTGSNTFGKVIANNTGATNATSLVKAGGGKWILDQTNTYTGTTSVDDGTLLVNGSTAAGSTVSVASGATLGGTGTIGGAVNVTGILSPGASIETLGTGTLSFANGSTLMHELDSSVATSSGSDLLKVTGNLNLAGTVGLNLSDIASTDVAFNVSDVFSLINYTGTWNSGLFTYGGNELADEEVFSFGLNTWRISYDDAVGGLNFSGEYAGGSDSFVNLTVVSVIPEPRVALLGGLGLLMLLRRRR